LIETHAKINNQFILLFLWELLIDLIVCSKDYTVAMVKSTCFSTAFEYEPKDSKLRTQGYTYSGLTRGGKFTRARSHLGGPWSYKCKNIE